MGCSYLGRKEGDLHCEDPSKPAWALAFFGLEGKNTLLSALLPGRLQDGSQRMQLHVKAGDLQDTSVHSEAFADTVAQLILFVNKSHSILKASRGDRRGGA